jgi:hypothetical protein
VNELLFRPSAVQFLNEYVTTDFVRLIVALPPATARPAMAVFMALEVALALSLV